MNEKIKELVTESKLMSINEELDLEIINAHDATRVEKFAELIVKETINEMIGQMWNYGIDESNNPSFYKAVDNVKEHFGIQE